MESVNNILAIVCPQLHTSIMSHIATLVTRTARKGRHDVFFFVEPWNALVRELDSEDAITGFPSSIHGCRLQDGRWKMLSCSGGVGRSMKAAGEWVAYLAAQNADFSYLQHHNI